MILSISPQQNILLKKILVKPFFVTINKNVRTLGGKVILILVVLTMFNEKNMFLNLNFFPPKLITIVQLIGYTERKKFFNIVS